MHTLWRTFVKRSFLFLFFDCTHNFGSLVIGCNIENIPLGLSADVGQLGSRQEQIDEPLQSSAKYLTFVLPTFQEIPSGKQAGNTTRQVIGIFGTFQL